MKRNLSILILFFPFLLFAQSQLELLASPNFSHRIITNEGIVQTVRDSELGKLNAHFSFNYAQQLKPHLWLKIGLGFSSQGYKYKSSTIDGLRYGSQHDGMGGFDPNLPSEASSVKFKYNYQFFEIPIALRYEFSERKWTPFFEVGISTMYYVQSIIKGTVDEKDTFTERFRDEEYINQIQFAPTLAFGVAYNINEKWQTFILPNFRVHLTKLTDAPVKERLWNGGIALGMRMNLK